FCYSVTQYDQIIRVSNHRTKMRKFLFPDRVQVVQINISQKRRYDAALRAADDRFMKLITFHDACCEPSSDHLEDFPVRYSLFYQGHEFVMRDVVKISLDVY